MPNGDACGDEMIEIHGLQIEVDHSAPVRGLDLKVERGEIFGLIGPRGSGKSALMKTLATLQPPAAGWARVDGLDVVAQAADVRRRIGYLPDFSGIYDDMRVEELMRFYARAQHLEPEAAHARIDALLELGGMADRRNEPIKPLDREWKRRLGLLKILLHAPHVLLLDDPCMGLAPAARERICELIRAVHEREGCTILLGTNLLSDAATLCGRMAVLFNGRKLAEGPAAELADRLTPGRMIQLRTTGEIENLRQSVASHPAVLQAEIHAGGIVFNLRHGQDRPMPVIEELARRGLPIAAWREHGINIGMLLEPDTGNGAGQ